MKTEFKITLSKILKFIIIVLIIDFSFGAISKSMFFNQKTGKFSRSTYAITKGDENILIFGSSHAHRHYVPEVIEKQLKKTCYNLGADGQQLLFHTALQKMILKRTKPEIIILNIDENFLYKSDVAYDRLKDLYPYYSDFKDVLRPFFSLKSNFTDLKFFFKSYQTNSTLIHIARYYLSPQIDYKGYRPLYGEMTQKKIDIHKKTNLEKEYVEEIENEFVNALQNFIFDAKQYNIKIFFISSPNLIARDVSNNESLKKIKHIAHLKKVPFFDFSNSSKFVNKLNLFHDPSHLNDKGARIFTDSIAKLINRYQDLP